MARFVSLLRRLTQYLQSYTHRLVSSTFKSVTHRPSAEKEWQQPAMEEVVLPMYPALAFRSPPLEVQAASYLAASVRMVSFSRTSILPEGSPPPGMAPGRALDGVDDPEELRGQKDHAYQNKKESPAAHGKNLLDRTFVLIAL